MPINIIAMLINIIEMLINTIVMLINIILMSHLYVSPLRPLVGVEDTDNNGNSSYAPLWYSTAMQHLIDFYHKGKVHKLSWSNKKHDRTSSHFIITAL